MNLLTALEIYNNYPKEILIEAQKLKNEKWTSFMYRLKLGEIHKMMVSFNIDEKFDGFETEEIALEQMHGLAKAAIDYCENMDKNNGNS